MSKIRFFKYSGSKFRFTDIINQNINNIPKDISIYVEPFVGTGAILFNLEREFDSYYINDVNRNIIIMYLAFQQGSFKELENFYYDLKKQFGDWGRNKEIYYQTRNYLNKKYFNTNTIKEGFSNYIIGRSCINSMLRWSKNGFNQGWGNRGFELGIVEKDFNFIKKRLLKTSIYSGDYKILFDLDSTKTFFFLDPPYSDANLTYSNFLFDNKEKNIFLNKIKNLKGNILYTDLYSEEINKILNWNYFIFNKTLSIRPSKNAGQKRGDETLFANYEIK